MTQESIEKYLVENAKKVSEAIERWNDSVSIGILLYLAREEVAPIYELENVFGKYISTEEEIMKIIDRLKI